MSSKQEICHYHIYITYDWRYNRSQLVADRESRKNEILNTVNCRYLADKQLAPQSLELGSDNSVLRTLGCDETDDTRCVFSAACENMADEKRVAECESSRNKAVEFVVGDANSSEDCPITSNGTVGSGLGMKSSERRHPCLIGVAGGTASGKVCRCPHTVARQTAV
jgi:hypothetical protein